MNLSVEGKRALVTGASSGLGVRFATVLAESGAHVILAARRVDKLEALRDDLKAAGRSASAVALDVADPASVADAFEAAGRVDILVNNAGITGTTPALNMPDDEWRAVIDTNLNGCFYVARAAAQSMAETGGGSIVNIASILGFRVAGLLSHYAAAKAGLVQLTKALALEWARYGIRVNAIAPGYIATDINAGFFDTEAGQALVKRIPQRRLGEPHELDGALMLLASDAGSYLTGATIPVDGGHLCASL